MTDAGDLDVTQEMNASPVLHAAVIFSVASSLKSLLEDSLWKPMKYLQLWVNC